MKRKFKEKKKQSYKSKKKAEFSKTAIPKNPVHTPLMRGGVKLS